MIRRYWSFAVIVLTSAAGAAIASETDNYNYDARGRLISVSRSGSVNNGVGVTYALDKEGNRTQVVVSAVGGGGGAPVAVADSGTYSTYDACNGIGLTVLANDSDTGGHYPLSVVSVTSSDPNFWSSNPYVFYTTGGWLYPGTTTATYTIQNSIGQQASGTITITLTGEARSCD